MRPSLRSPAQRLVGILTVAAILLTLHVSMSQARPTSGAPPTDPVTPTEVGGPVSIDSAATREQPRRVTLISGETVSYAKTGDGYAVDVVEPRQSPGPAPSYTTEAGPDSVYVIPSDAWQLIQQDRVDKELFNVSYLAENGYADGQRDSVPVILQYADRLDAKSVTSRARGLDHSRLTTTLASIDSAAVRVAKSGADQLWDQLVADSATPRSTALAQGIQKIWLDRKMSLALDESVPLIGAPDAWAAGYDGTGVTVAVLDGGIDATHPDVADQVAASETFVDGTPADGNGHGTHVASTIAGTGAASDGRYKGVAPGADLVVGKVCSDSGSCPWSSVIEGMEWAAVEQGADIVSVSLGGCCSDGTDPGSLAVNELTASTGALFVIAAGNSGPAAETVTSPGAADAALTVAATSKTDQLAGFSGRGPRLDGALKPEIAAPGVDIVAARATGTSMGEPVDELYTAADGTSMATPHVSGAAALLKQRHPDWDADELKAALMSTAVDVDRTVYEVGAGRLDIGRAISQEVFAVEPKLDFGLQEIGDDGEPPSPAPKSVTYTNLSDQPVTLQLAADLAGSGGSVPGAVSAAESVTVPAHGTATVEVTLSYDDLSMGQYSGAIVAEDAATDTRVTTPIGTVVEPMRHTLTVRTVGPDGQPLTPSGQDTIEVTGPGWRADLTELVGTGITQTAVPAGTYSVAQKVAWVGSDDRLSMALLVNPEVEVRGDTEITLDARTAVQVEYDTPKQSSPINVRPMIGYQRTSTGDTAYEAWILPPSTQGPWTRLWATPTAEVNSGGFRFWSQQLLGYPEVTMTTGPGRKPIELTTPVHGQYRIPEPHGAVGSRQERYPDWRPFQGVRELRLVDVGGGGPDDLAGLDLHGKLALVEAGTLYDNPFGGQICGLDVVVMQQIRDAGAVGIVAFPGADQPCGYRLPIPIPVAQQPLTGDAKPIGIPNVHVSTEVGLSLRERIEVKPLRVRVVGTPDSPYTYVLKKYEEDRIPDSLHYDLGHRDLGTVRFDYRAPREAWIYESRAVGQREDLVAHQLLPQDGAPSLTGPAERVEYFGPVADDLYITRSATARHGLGAPEGWSNRVYRDTPAEPFINRRNDSRVVFGTPRTPGVEPGSEMFRVGGEVSSRATFGNCYLCRQGRFLIGYLEMAAGGPDDFTLSSGGSIEGPEEGFEDIDFHLYRDGEEVEPLLVFLGRPIYSLPDEEGDYRMSIAGPTTEAEWTFTSAKPTEDTRRSGYQCPPEVYELSSDPCAPLPMLFASYDLSDSIRGYGTVRAKGMHRFELFAYHGESTAEWPAITSAKVWTRVGDGDWRPAKVRRTGRDSVGNTTYRVVAHYPRVGREGAPVDLRVETRDADGSQLTQTTNDAFTLVR